MREGGAGVQRCAGLRSLRVGSGSSSSGTGLHRGEKTTTLYLSTAVRVRALLGEGKDAFCCCAAQCGQTDKRQAAIDLPHLAANGSPIKGLKGPKGAT